MSDGSEWIIGGAFMFVLAGIALAYWIERRPGPVSFSEEHYGDATETERVIHNTRRANHARTGK